MNRNGYRTLLIAATLALHPALVLAHGDATTHNATHPKSDKATKAPRSKARLALGATAAPDGRLWIAGVNGEGRLFLQSSTDAGTTWSEQRLLDIGKDTPMANGEAHPGVAFAPASHGNWVVVTYNQALAKPYTGEVRMLRSTDGGKTFSAPFTVHRDRQIITHSFESAGFDAGGVLHTIWIDKRDKVLRGDKAASYAGAAIYRNESRDGGLTFGPDIKVVDHGCECCRIALTRTPDGRLTAMWRQVFEPNIRDHAIAVLGEQGTSMVRATFDGWKLDACPHHGPGLAAAQSGGYHAVWFGERAGRSAVRYGRLAADGSPQGEVRELPDPRAEHADIITSGTQVAMVWRSYDGAKTHLKAWVSDDEGARFAVRDLASSTDENDQPRVVALKQGMHVVWRTAKEIHVIPVIP
jgi:hypothetical protein